MYIWSIFFERAMSHLLNFVPVVNVGAAFELLVQDYIRELRCRGKGVHEGALFGKAGEQGERVSYPLVLVWDLFMVSFVPQDGCLAAILQLLALNHCACLRNARRISYQG